MTERPTGAWLPHRYEKVLFVSDLWLGEGRCNFDLSNFAAGLATGLQLHFLPGICARAEKQDPRNLSVNRNLVQALVEIVCCCCCRLPAIRYFLRSQR